MVIDCKVIIEPEEINRILKYFLFLDRKNKKRNELNKAILLIVAITILLLVIIFPDTPVIEWIFIPAILFLIYAVFKYMQTVIDNRIAYEKNNGELNKVISQIAYEEYQLQMNNEKLVIKYNDDIKEYYLNEILKTVEIADCMILELKDSEYLLLSKSAVASNDYTIIADLLNENN